MDIEKEDGQNDFVICQLKSTDAQSIKVNQKDIRILEKNATVAHKMPMFAIQFLNTNEVWLMCKPEDLSCIAEYVNTGEVKENIFDIDLSSSKDVLVNPKRVIKSSGNSRNKFHEEVNKKYDRTRSAK